MREPRGLKREGRKRGEKDRGTKRDVKIRIQSIKTACVRHVF